MLSWVLSWEQGQNLGSCQGRVRSAVSGRSLQELLFGFLRWFL